MGLVAFSIILSSLTLSNTSSSIYTFLYDGIWVLTTYLKFFDIDVLLRLVIELLFKEDKLDCLNNLSPFSRAMLLRFDFLLLALTKDDMLGLYACGSIKSDDYWRNKVPSRSIFFTPTFYGISNF